MPTEDDRQVVEETIRVNSEDQIRAFLQRDDVKELLLMKHEFGRLPIHDACLFGVDKACLQLILDAGVHQGVAKKMLEEKTNYGSTCLHLACCHNLSANSLRFLLECMSKHADIKKVLEEKNNDGEICLHYACRYNCSTDSLRLLLEYLSNHAGIKKVFDEKNYLGFKKMLQEKSKDGWTCLHCACANKISADSLRLLLEYLSKHTNTKKMLEEKNKYGVTCLHLACWKYLSTDSLRLLLEFLSKHADIKKMLEEKDNDGKTCLHYACANALSTDSLRLLLEYLTKHADIKKMLEENGDKENSERVREVIVDFFNAKLSDTEQKHTDTEQKLKNTKHECESISHDLFSCKQTVSKLNGKLVRQHEYLQGTKKQLDESQSQLSRLEKQLDTNRTNFIHLMQQHNVTKDRLSQTTEKLHSAEEALKTESKSQKQQLCAQQLAQLQQQFTASLIKQANRDLTHPMLPLSEHSARLEELRNRRSAHEEVHSDLEAAITRLEQHIISCTSNFTSDFEFSRHSLHNEESVTRSRMIEQVQSQLEIKREECDARGELFTNNNTDRLQHFQKVVGEVHLAHLYKSATECGRDIHRSKFEMLLNDAEATARARVVDQEINEFRSVFHNFLIDNHQVHFFELSSTLQADLLFQRHRRDSLQNAESTCAGISNNFVKFYVKRYELTIDSNIVANYVPGVQTIRNEIDGVMEYLRELEIENVHSLTDHEFRTLFVYNIHQLSDFLELDSADLLVMNLNKDERKNVSRLIKVENEKLYRREHFELRKQNSRQTEQLQSQTNELNNLKSKFEALMQVVSQGGGVPIPALPTGREQVDHSTHSNQQQQQQQQQQRVPPSVAPIVLGTTMINDTTSDSSSSCSSPRSLKNPSETMVAPPAPPPSDDVSRPNIRSDTTGSACY